MKWNEENAKERKWNRMQWNGMTGDRKSVGPKPGGPCDPREHLTTAPPTRNHRKYRSPARQKPICQTTKSFGMNCIGCGFGYRATDQNYNNKKKYDVAEAGTGEAAARRTPR